MIYGWALKAGHSINHMHHRVLETALHLPKHLDVLVSAQLGIDVGSSGSQHLQMPKALV